MKLVLLGTLLVALSSQLFAKDVLNVVAATTDFADIAQAVGGDKVQVQSLTKGNVDLHLVEPRPSMVLAVRNADLLIRVGMDMDLWAQSLVDAAKNARVQTGGVGSLDLSQFITKLEVPVGKVDMGMGDVHVYGNPHYQTDPRNGLIFAREIARRLAQLKPDAADYFERNHQIYAAKLQAAIDRWEAALRPYRGLKVVSYHESLTYFAHRFGLEVVDTIEVKPGIPPTPKHLQDLAERMKRDQIKVILIEPFYAQDAARAVAKTTGATVVVFGINVGALPEIKSYIDLFDANVDHLLAALR